MKKVFIDGTYGIAGYSLKEKLNPLVLSEEVEIIELSETEAKNEVLRYEMINNVDIAVLCLPEAASAKTCEDLKESNTIIIDASTYHRTVDGWTYGYQELDENQIKKIIESNRIANPGCFATGMLTVLNPIKEILKKDYPINIYGVTGYSAGGKQTIEKQEKSPLNYRVTNLTREHIHLKEVKHWLNVKSPFAFIPSVGGFKYGQMIELNIFQEQINIPIKEVKELFVNYYKKFTGNIVITDSKMIIPENMAGKDEMEIHLSQPGSYLQIFAVYDNLGKGSSGSIVQIIKKLL
jgi:N-acetyl-gamma-glutamyl-phosphate reductase